VKPIRDYSEGQWLLLLWAFIVLFLLAGIALGVLPLVVISLIAAAGAGYTTYLYVQQNVAPRPLPPSLNPNDDGPAHRPGRTDSDAEGGRP
jgi:hypothetical protein